VGGCEKSQFFVAEMRMQTWRWTDPYWRCSKCRASSQALGEVLLHFSSRL